MSPWNLQVIGFLHNAIMHEFLFLEIIRNDTDIIFLHTFVGIVVTRGNIFLCIYFQ